MDYIDFNIDENKIANIQETLRIIGYNVVVNGIYDNDTKAAIIDFKAKNGLAINETVDNATFTLLRQNATEILVEYSDIEPIFPFPNSRGYTVKYGERSDLVLIIQYMLTELDVFYDFPIRVALSGLYDEATREAVMNLQRITGLERTGNVNAKTWNRLATEFNLINQ